MDLEQEFENQLQNLIDKDYPCEAKLSEEKFSSNIRTLRDKLDEVTIDEINLETGMLPFVIVIKNDLIPTTFAMSVVKKDGKNGITKLYPHEPEDFSPIENVDIPKGIAYLLIDIDRGKDNINLPPKEAMRLIKKSGRSPLTIDEGVAIVTHHPGFLMKNNCFSLLASRHSGDKRVPAIWINAKKHPNLGWCWEGNPHTWLGSASCRKRVGVD